jgi:hypothetical protein
VRRQVLGETTAHDDDGDTEPQPVPAQKRRRTRGQAHSPRPSAPVPSACPERFAAPGAPSGITGGLASSLVALLPALAPSGAGRWTSRQRLTALRCMLDGIPAADNGAEVLRRLGGLAGDWCRWCIDAAQRDQQGVVGLVIGAAPPPFPRRACGDPPSLPLRSLLQLVPPNQLPSRLVAFSGWGLSLASLA